MSTERPVATIGTAGGVRILNCLPSRGTEDDWRLRHAERAGVLSVAEAAPAERDLRADWWRVGDQGSTGSCVGWASADSVLRWHFVTAGQLGEDDVLSTRFAWMAAKEIDELSSAPTTFIDSAGTSLKAALDVARKFGALPDSDLPFASGALYRGEAATLYATATRFKIRSYFNLGPDLDAWRSWLAASGPILTRLDVDDTWDQATANDGVLDKYLSDTARGGHAVALVGYRHGDFIVRNSWGSGWGDGGFAYASTAYAEEAFTEAYGVGA